MEEPPLKPEFESRYKELLGEKEYKKFYKYSSMYIRKCIRINTLKSSIDEVKAKLEGSWNLTQVPWCKEGFWIEFKDGKRFDIGNLPEHQLGQVYVQDAASMIPPVVLGPEPGEKVLDLCAAPGSKTSQLSQYMQNKGILIANDSSGKRIKALGLNLQRCGVSNAVITIMHGKDLTRKEGEFDRVLVDAPCSGTGTIRRNYKIAEMWSPGLVKRMAATQYNLITAGFRALKKGGIMVYSTCTLEPEENEFIVDRLLKENEDAELIEISLNINKSAAITSYDGTDLSPQINKCLRINPQDNDTEGFFVAKIIKK